MRFANPRAVSGKQEPSLSRIAQVLVSSTGSEKNGKIIRFGCRNQIIRNPYIFPAIQPGKKLHFPTWIIFKCLAVLYVDPQNLMTNRRNRSLVGPVSVSREKQCREQGINTSITYIVSP